MQAIEIYRSRFRPSEQLAAPHVMPGISVFAAQPMPRRGASSPRSSRPSSICAPTGPARYRRPTRDHRRLLADERGMLDRALSCAVVGSPETVRRGLAAFIARPAPTS